jgi:hypothetical protein
VLLHQEEEDEDGMWQLGGFLQQNVCGLPDVVVGHL